MESLAVVLDEACTSICRAQEADRTCRTMRVSPAVYRAILESKPGDVRRGWPLMLLDLEVVPDLSLAGEAVEVA